MINLAKTSGLYSINDLDIFTTWGLVIRSGTDDLLKYPDRKPPAISKDWGDEDGLDVDTSTPKFKEKEANLLISIIANNENDFWTKYNALFDNVLSQPGEFRFYVAEFDRSFFLYYDSTTSTSRLTKIKIDPNLPEKVVCNYTIKLIEPIPSFMQKFSYLVDENNDYLTAPEGFKLIVT